MNTPDEIARRRRIKRFADSKAVRALRRADARRNAETVARDSKIARSLAVADEMISRAEAEGMSPLEWLSRETMTAEEGAEES